MGEKDTFSGEFPRFPEKKERKEDASSEPIIFFVRHGASNYEGEGLDITEEGVRQMEEVAEFFANSLDKDKDVLVLISSLKARARGSLMVLRKKLEEFGFKIVQLPKDKEYRERLSGMNTMDKEGKPHSIEGAEFNEVMERVWSSCLSSDKLKEKIQEWAKNDQFAFHAAEGRTNTYGEMSLDINREVSFVKRAVSLYFSESDVEKRVVIIGVTHGEVIDFILQNHAEKIFSLKENGEEATLGGIVRL